MAVYTKIDQTEIRIIESKFNIGKILSFSGIKKGIENTNYLMKTKRGKYILTIFEKQLKLFNRKGHSPIRITRKDLKVHG